MRRWSLVVVLCLACAACKVVNSTAYDSGVESSVVAGFTSAESRFHEAFGYGTVSIALSAPASHSVQVHVGAFGKTATAGDDYTFADNIVNFSPGETMRTITVYLVPDEIEEPDETLTLEIERANGASLARTEHTMTITSAKMPEVNVEVPSLSVSEITTGEIRLRLTEPAPVGVNVFFTVSGTASGTDYSIGNAVFIPAGALTGSVPFDVFDDSSDEPDETVVITLTNATNAVVGTSRVHTYTIRDNDAPPYVSFMQTSFSVFEGNASTTTLVLRAQLSAPSTTEVSVPFQILSTGTATAGQDFTVSTTSPLVFSPGSTTATLSLAVTGDTVVEGSEYAIVELQQPTNALLGGIPTASAYMRNDDCLGTGKFAICPDAPLPDSVVLPSSLYTVGDAYCTSSSLGIWTTNGQPWPCVVFARSITVGSTFGWGYRPLVLVATESITITDTLDVSARGTSQAPGSMYCSPTTYPASRAGGAGGSFMTLGGSGGAHTNPTGPGGVAGPAASSPPPLLYGGCSGSAGGDNFASTAPLGGGAVYLVAGSSITLQSNAVINASGGSALGSFNTSSSGGSGGGSGGMIVLHAPAITATGAFIVANGGAGAEGATASAAGGDGAIVDPRNPLVPAAGGTGTQGGNGGNGFAEGSPATSGANGNNTNGGGGGGGGAGYIQSNQPLTGATVSPAPS